MPCPPLDTAFRSSVIGVGFCCSCPFHNCFGLISAVAAGAAAVAAGAAFPHWNNSFRPLAYIHRFLGFDNIFPSPKVNYAGEILFF